MTNPPTEQQLAEISTRAAHLHEYALLDDVQAQREADQLTGTDVPQLVAEVRRLRHQVREYGELAARRESELISLRAWVRELERPAVEAKRNEIRQSFADLAGHGTPAPVAGGVATPTPSRVYLEMELKRTELDKGFTDQEWAVGGIVCPEGFSCVSHPLTVFRPTNKGRLPVHRHERFGDACLGSGQKPTTPPLQLKPAAPAAPAASRDREEQWKREDAAQPAVRVVAADTNPTNH